MSDFFTSANEWLNGHLQLVTIVGIPILTLCVTSFVNRSAEKRSAQERRIERNLAKEMKLADFRQKWIDALRNDMAEFIAMTLEDAEKRAHEHYINQNMIFARINLRLNPNDPNYNSLLKCLGNLVEAKDKSDDETKDLASRATILCQEMLKIEWDRLKSDLQQIEGQGVDSQRAIGL